MDEFDPMSSVNSPPETNPYGENDDFVQLDTPAQEAVSSSGRDEAAEEDLYTAPVQSSEAEPSQLLNFGDPDPPMPSTETYGEEPESTYPDTSIQDQEPEPEPEPESKPPTEEPPVIELEEQPSKTGGIFDGLQNLDPRVVELIYWRDLKKSGIVFGSVLFLLLSLSFNSLISVIAYLSLAVLTVTISFRVYKTVLQAVQKTGEGNPFKPFLESDIEVPSDKVDKIVNHVCEHLSCVAKELRRLFLVEDLVDSIKFAVMLWLLTYIGGWFNGLTLLILGFIGLFTMPKVYELHQEKIDNYIDLVNKQVKDVMAKVQAKVPLLKKKTA
ncbi:reticulon-1-A-like isoform X3 [Glandiceps talaboti]